SFAWLAKISTLSLFLYFKSFCWLCFDANALLCMLRLFGGQTSKYLQNFCPSKHGSAVWVGSFAWLAKISTLSLFLCFISFCWSDCDDNALRWVLRLFGGRASNYLITFVLQNMGRQFGSAVSLGWQKSVLSAYFSVSYRSVGQIVMIMLCVGCFVSSVDELRIIS